MLIVCQRDAFFDFSGVLAAVEKDVFDTAWKKIKENPDQFTGVDGAPECRETNLKTAVISFLPISQAVRERTS